ncbi:hypothetical protein J2855_001800 [Agrobacterium tumefaciens]|uniref:hypothetical protein n=1 Tax=Agrobacterium tumefaciens TaxID=358 RepID=UPI001AE445D1|nr:hypothetical protein [Agrobacterium tumefaciens]MBP2508165.1 hypothetical protein [Agrobacterium tumefaciens]MBP2517317.1 hypothetical protein [Agrobacterium tumefaciens]MBP2575951.1 hypothetical protein [Agrobacterium tumefaciens]MBP2594307.1 hypothetical protein [Agrobacterium tumefaciens]
MTKMEEICSVSFADHEAASELLREFTGKEGGIATVDWYLLRNKIADAISMTRVDEREKCRQLLSEAEAALDEREIASGLTSNGNLWRFWAEIAKDMAVKLSEAEKSEREATAKALGDAASAIFVMGAWSPHYEKLVPNTFDEGTSAAYEIVREIQGKAESALQSEER